MVPPPESSEKRQRERRKQQRRAEKRERRAQRNAEKRFRRDGGGELEWHTLRRGDSDHYVDSEVWLSTLDLAAMQGWTPSEQSLSTGNGRFTQPGGMMIAAEDALALAQTLEAELPGIDDEPQETEGLEFGEGHTESLLELRAEGVNVGEAEVLGARAILSGPPKREAERFAAFLRGGAFTVDLG